MLVLALRVALCLGLLAIPAVVVTGPAAKAAAVAAAAAGDPTSSVSARHAAALSAAIHVTVLFAATTPLQAWLKTVGEVSHLAGLVIPATFLAAGAAVATASVSTAPAFLAAASAGEAAAFIAAGNALKSPIIGSIAATVLVLFLVAGYALTPPPPVGFLALVGCAGMTVGAAVYSLASWVVAPDWATDRALDAAGRAVELTGDLVRLGGGGAWRFEGGGQGGQVLPPPPPPPPPPPDSILPAGGELSVPRPPSCVRRRRRAWLGQRAQRDLEASAAASAVPPPSSSSSSSSPAAAAAAAADAWARVHASLAQAALYRGVARGEGCAGVFGRLRLLHPQLPALTALLPARWRHFPSPAAVALADATAGYARLAWTMASLVSTGPPLAGPAAEVVLRCYGTEALGRVGDAAAVAAAAIAAAVPRRYGRSSCAPPPADGGGGVAAAELAALDAAVEEIGALHDAGAAAVSDDDDEKEAAEVVKAPSISTTLASLMAAAAAEDGTFLDEIRFASWQSGLLPLAEAMRRVAEAVEAVRVAMP